MFNNERCMDMGAMPMEGAMHKEMHHKEMKMDAMPAAMPTMMIDGCAPMPGCVCPPVMECPQERCCHRTIVHEVPHVQPINTRIINHHVYRHTYEPCFTCCEENVCSNVYEGPRCGC